MKASEKIVMGDGVKSAINKISGAYTIPLIDKLFPEGKNLSDMEDIYFALVTLSEMGKTIEAMHMIRGLFGIAGEEYPQLIAMMEKQKQMQDFFIIEFIEDFYDMIDECKLQDK